MTATATPTATARHPAIAPHGGVLVDRTGARPDDIDSLESVPLTARELADLDMLACGALSPLEGFMGRDDYHRVLDEMRLSSGLPWTLPVCLAVDEMPRRDRVALADMSGRRLAVIEVDEVYDYDMRYEAERCFRTTRATHPGVARLYAQKRHYLAGPVTVFERPRPPFPDLAFDPLDTRREFASRGWSRVAGFQTRNPIHRAHEYLTKVALETLDGVLIHPLLGETKADDVHAATRVECYRALVANYYPANRVAVAAFPAAMRYAGPREAVWHAICRKNYGCSHFIVGRDHAGVGGYYGTFDSQAIFAAFEPGELEIEPMFFEHVHWCRACGSIASPKTCPHGPDAHVRLSGTKVRDLLEHGHAPPAELMRPEIAEILIRAYGSVRKPTSNGLSRPN
jgi:sulfate adenylyltransferase